MKKLFTLLTMLVLCIGGTWADGNKRVLNSQNYESATATDWTGNTATVTLGTGDATYGNYAKVENSSSSGNRTAYKSVTLDYTAGTGYTTADMTTAGYIVEFDMKIQSGNNSSGQSEFVVSTASSVNPGQNTYYSGTDYLFTLSQATLGSSSRNTSWFINDPGNSSTTKATLSYDNWYHYKLVVTASSVDYTITQVGASTATATGSKTVTALPVITGFNTLCGRYVGFTYFDNLEIYDYTQDATATEPTITLNKVSGTDRIYTISYTEGETLHYKLPGATDYTTVSTGSSIEVTATESGKLLAYTTLGTSTSTEASVDVTCEAVILNAPTYWKKSLTGDTYTIEFYSDQSKVLLTPTAKIMYSINGATAQEYSTAVDVPVCSTITAYCTADGYTNSASTSCTPFVLKGYTTTKTLDFTTLTDGLGANGTKTATFGTSSTYYQYLGDGTNAFDEDFYVANTEISGKNTYRFYCHNGGLYAFYGGNRGIGIANLKAGQIVKINSSIAPQTGANDAYLGAYDYGNIHYFTVSADGNCSFSITRYTIIYSIEVLSPANNGEVVGAVDYSTGWFGAFNTNPVYFEKGQTAYYKFINHNKYSAASTWNNWNIWVANSSSVNKINLRADNAANKLDGYEIGTFGNSDNYNATNVNFATDLTDATVELFVAYNEDGSVKVTAKTTKANGKALPDYIYTQTGFDDEQLKVYVSVDNSWVEIVKQDKYDGIADASANLGISSLGWGTFIAPFECSIPDGVTAYNVTVIDGYIVKDKAEETFAANIPYLVQSDNAVSTTLYGVAETATNDYKDGALVGNVGVPTYVAAGNYLLQYNNIAGDGETANYKLGFYKVAANNTLKIGTNRCYLTTGNNAKAAYFLDDTPTAVAGVEAAETVNAQPVKAIQNGRLVIKTANGTFNAAGARVK